MKFGISTASFFPRAFTEDAALTIQTLGAECAEVFLQTWSEYDADFGRVVKQRAPELNITSVHVLTTHIEPCMFSSGARQRADAWALYEKALEAGEAMGAQYYVMHGQASMKNHNYMPTLMQMVDVLGPALEIAASHGMQLTLENVSWCMLRTPETVRLLREQLPQLGFTLDIKQAWEGNQDDECFLDAMGSALLNVHICDRIGNGNLALPGRGKYDFPDFFARLKSRGYDGPVIIEVYDRCFSEVSELEQSLSYVRKAASQ